MIDEAANSDVRVLVAVTQAGQFGSVFISMFTIHTAMLMPMEAFPLLLLLSTYPSCKIQYL